MASGKKNYFRHSMNARNDHKLRTFMDSFGRNWRDGYFYFFTLLELCGNDAQEGKIEHTFHKKTLRELWGVSAQGVHDVCTRCTQSALVMCKVDANHVTFSLPNLLNYTGRYDSKAPNKENKINKEKKEEKASPVVVLEPEKNLPEIQPQDFRNPKDSVNAGLFAIEAPTLDEETHVEEKASTAITLLNSLCFKNFRPTAANLKHVNARLKEGYTFEEFKKVINFLQEKWGNDAKMRPYLRPETIFGTKFDSYLAEASDERLKAISDDDLIRQFFPGYSA